MATDNERDAGQQCPAPFRDTACRYYEQGLSAIPCNGKIPAIRGWKRYQSQRVTPAGLEKWIVSRAHCNIGIVTGQLSGLTVLDSDVPEITAAELMQEFGQTPLIAQTPRGGFHLYYRHNGERNKTGLDGRKVDIRGEGGLIIAPPSWNASTGQQYRFVIGSEWDLSSLPVMLMPSAAAMPTEGEGIRNNNLFAYVKDSALQIQDEAELLDLALMFNEAVNQIPLPEWEVRKTVKSVWQYKAAGRLFAKGQQYLRYHGELHCSLWKTSPNAVCLLSYLQAHHNNRREPFAICPKAIGKSLDIDWRRIHRAISVLEQAGILRRVYEGGKGSGDPHLYGWVQNQYPI
jgi:Bifunctional DNA primase/polymerase, N-terminal/Primase C terminal 1 (PriCT-1)